MTRRSATTARISLVCSSTGRQVDGVRDYSDELFAVLVESGVETQLLEHRSGGWTRQTAAGSVEDIGAQDAVGSLRASRWVIVQYSPFAFGRGGCAPWLLRLIGQTARATQVAVMIHEAYVDWGTGRQRPMSAWQRLQLRRIVATADLVLTSTEAWSHSVAGWVTRPPVHLGVGSNLPDMRPMRAPAREALGVRVGQVVLGSLSTGHDSGLPGHVSAAVAEAARQQRDVVHLNLGATAPATAGATRTVRPGWLTKESLAEMVAAVDVFLAPFKDGASTRRTSVMAALQHGVPVVSTDGPHTDRVSTTPGSGVVLAPVGRSSDYAQIVAKIAGSDRRRMELGSAARRCYERDFAWPVIAGRLVNELARLERPPTTARFKQPLLSTRSGPTRMQLSRSDQQRLERERDEHDAIAASIDPDRMTVPAAGPLELAIFDAAYVQPGTKVLDLGCGSGDLSLQLLARGATVTGVDISPGMIGVARRRAELHFPEARAEFIAAPVEEMRLAPGSFDAVVGRFILHHLDLDAGAAEIAKLLAPGGRASFAENSAKNPLLMFARGHLVGRLGVVRLGTPDERPLSRRTSRG